MTLEILKTDWSTEIIYLTLMTGIGIHYTQIKEIRIRDDGGNVVYFDIRKEPEIK